MEKRRIRKIMVGTIVSDKMDKTIVVEVDRLVQHPVYKKYIHRRTKFKAHDESNAGKIGDKVEITQTRPLAKTKHWRMSKILSHQA